MAVKIVAEEFPGFEEERLDEPLCGRLQIHITYEGYVGGSVTGGPLDHTVACVRPMFHGRRTRNCIINPREVFSDKTRIKILFTYPLARAVYLTFENAGGFTRIDFYDAIAAGYQQIYDRKQGSDEPYATRGHEFDNLWIENIWEAAPGVFHMSVRS